MPTKFELERLKPKLDNFKIPENRVHELTDSNVSPLMSHPAAPWRSLLSVSSGSLDLRSSHGLQGSLLGSATRLL